MTAQATQMSQELFEWAASVGRPVHGIVVHPLGLAHRWLVFWAGPTEHEQRNKEVLTLQMPNA